jgi:uncharacterized membrane-anchored protein YitT (DUF2179 family)
MSAPPPPPFPVARTLRDNPRSARRAFLVRFGRPLSFAGAAAGVAAGAFLIAWALNAFYVPTQLLAGGVTGIALLLRDLAGFRIGLVIALLNVPIFLLGFRDIGVRFAALSAIGVLALSLFTDFLPVRPLTDDPLLASIFGGVVVGIGGGLALRAGGSTGGFDILGVVLNRRFGLGVSEVLLFLNGALILAKGLLGTPELAMYTLVAIWTSARAMDALMASRPRKAFLIVSRKSDEIRRRVLEQMRRGVTILDGEGGHTGTPLKVLLVVVQRVEMRELRDVIRAADPQAFVAVLEASDVMGYFRRQTAIDYLRKRADRAED